MSLEELMSWHEQERGKHKLNLLGWQESDLPEPDKGRHVQFFGKLIQFHAEAVKLLRKYL